MPPALVGVAVAARVGGERERGLFLGEFRAGVEVVGPAARGVGEAQTACRGGPATLEARLPYLCAEQRREVLRTTGLPCGYVLLDGFEPWGRLDLFAAADGYGAFGSGVGVTLDAAAGGFSAADAWRDDIGGRGGPAP